MLVVATLTSSYPSWPTHNLCNAKITMDSRKNELDALLVRATQLAKELQDELYSDTTYRANLVEKSKALTRALQTPVDQVADLDFTVFHLPATITAIRAGWLKTSA